jgi:tetratricopeptide (TPR) repeat protein
LAHVAWTQHAPLKIKIRESTIYCAAAKSIRPHWHPVLISVAWDLIDVTKDALNPTLGRAQLVGAGWLNLRPGRDSVKSLSAIAAFAALTLAGCETVAETVKVESPATTLTVQQPEDVKYYRSDEPLKLGIELFNRGNYGLAERYFRDAVEKAPRDVTAWVGLAASYDRLARFDLADRAYTSAIKLGGETTEILNNQGYSYMLRGDLVAARTKFLKALEREPDNPMIVNNLKLLNSSYRFIHRSADP